MFVFFLIVHQQNIDGIQPIPNVRFNVAKCLETLGIVLATSPAGQETLQQSVLPTLQTLQRDLDPDVNYLATKALRTLTPADA